MPTREQWKNLLKDNQWVSLNYLLDGDESTIFPPEVLRITCDTRDFSIHCGFNEAYINQDRGIVNLIKNPKMIKEDFCIKLEEIIPWLKQLQAWSGGIAQFRHLVFDCPEVTARQFWDFKYIRFYKHPELTDTFIVCNQHSKAVKWRLLQENQIVTKHLDILRLDDNESILQKRIEKAVPPLIKS